MRWLGASQRATGATLDATLDWLVAGMRLRHRDNRRRSTLASSGELRSRAHGSGLEFDRYRAFAPGDDIRGIDWRVSLLTRSLHSRVYHANTRLTTVVVLDRSASMAHPIAPGSASVTPWSIGGLLVLGIAAAHALARSTVHVALSATDQQGVRWLAPCDSLSDLSRLHQELASTRPGGRGQAWVSLRPPHASRPGLIVLVSDFHTVRDPELLELRHASARSTLGLIQLDGHRLELDSLARNGRVARVVDSERSLPTRTLIVDDALRERVGQRIQVLHRSLRSVVGGTGGHASLLNLHELGSREAVLTSLHKELDALGVP